MFVQLAPNPQLRHFIQFYRVLHFQFDPTIKDIPFKPYPPRPETCLSFYPRDTEKVAYPGSSQIIDSYRSALFGKHSVVTNRYVGRDFILIQVVFHPTGLHRLIGLSAFELTNAYLDATTVFSPEINQVNARLSSAENISEMVAIVETYLLKLAAHSPNETHALDSVSALMLQHLDRFSLDYLAKESCLSPKQFERKFMERVGVNPKYFARIIRFDKAFRLKNAHPEKDWLSIAIKCGYYDYQHLAKEYKEFTGYSPNAFYVQETQAPERAFGIVEV